MILNDFKKLFLIFTFDILEHVTTHQLEQKVPILNNQIVYYYLTSENGFSS